MSKIKGHTLRTACHNMCVHAMLADLPVQVLVEMLCAAYDYSFSSHAFLADLGLSGEETVTPALSVQVEKKLINMSFGNTRG